MAKIKPSELPTDTVIEDEVRGLFIRDDSLWHELYPHCGDCGELVSDEGTDDPSKYAPGVTESEPSDEFFQNFKVIAVPIDIPSDLLDQILKSQADLIEEEKTND